MKKLTLPLLALTISTLPLFAQKYIYKEDFDNANQKWYVGNDENTPSWIKDGRYYISFNKLTGNSGWSRWNDSIPVVLPKKKNYEIETSISGSSVDTATYYGLRWNIAHAILNVATQKWINFNSYEFMLRSDGYVALFHSDSKTNNRVQIIA